MTVDQDNKEDSSPKKTDYTEIGSQAGSGMVTTQPPKKRTISCVTCCLNFSYVLFLTAAIVLLILSYAVEKWKDELFVGGLVCLALGVICVVSFLMYYFRYNRRDYYPVYVGHLGTSAVPMSVA